MPDLRFLMIFHTARMARLDIKNRQCTAVLKASLQVEFHCHILILKQAPFFIKLDEAGWNQFICTV